MLTLVRKLSMVFLKVFLTLWKKPLLFFGRSTLVGLGELASTLTLVPESVWFASSTVSMIKRGGLTRLRMASAAAEGPAEAEGPSSAVTTSTASNKQG